jgi:hypothetical protein
MRTAALLGILATLLTACGGTSAPASKPGSAQTPASASAGGGLQAVVDGARKEGTRTLTYGEGTLGGGEGAKRCMSILSPVAAPYPSVFPTGAVAPSSMSSTGLPPIIALSGASGFGRFVA